MKFHFVTVVWGDSFTDLFLKVVLPSLLSPGNLGSFRHKSGSVYKIYTTPEDAKRIKESPVFLKLSEIMPTEIILIDDDVDLRNYWEYYYTAINTAVNDHAAFVMQPPDVVRADGTLVNLQKIAATGKKAVVHGIFRVTKETFVPAFLEHFYSEDDFTASASPRELVKLALEHLHSQTKSSFWDSAKFTPWPCYLFWSVNREGILARYFHKHSMMTSPRKKTGIGSSLGTLDGGGYIPFAHPNPDDLYIVEDSDEMFACDISDSTYSGLPGLSDIPANRASVFKVAYWAAGWQDPYNRNANSYHRKFVTHKIRIHFNDISPRWKEVEKSSDKVVNSICFLLKFAVMYDVYSFIRMRFLQGLKRAVGPRIYGVLKSLWYFLKGKRNEVR